MRWCRSTLGWLGLGGVAAVAGCTPTFDASDTEGGHAGIGAGQRGSAAAGRDGSLNGAGGHGPSGGRAGAVGAAGNLQGGGTGGAAASASGARGGAPQRGGAGGNGASGAADALGGSDSAGGSDLNGGSDSSGGSDERGGTSALGGRGGSSGNGGWGGALPEAGRGPTLGGAAGAMAAGRGGTAGAPDPSQFCLPVVTLDDMEDGDHLICPNQGRSGDWWSATGTVTGAIEPPTDVDFPAFALGASARAGSHYGMRLSGTGFAHTDDDWASLGFFVGGGSAKDLTAYQGLTFYGKATSSITIHVSFATATTTPTSDGGSCDDDCTDHYELAVPFTTSWQQFTVPFASVAQEGWGPKAKDLAHTLFIYFGYVGTDGGPASFDFLIDDVRLY